MSQSAALVAALHERGWTLAIAESLTGGDLTSAVVSVPGASAVLRGGVVAYATDLKRALLGVDAELLERCGPVHAEVALQMAQGARRVLGETSTPASMGLATTGIAGPQSPDGQPVGTVHIAVAINGVSRSRRFRFTGDREAVRAQAVQAALDEALIVLRE